MVDRARRLAHARGAWERIHSRRVESPTRAWTPGLPARAQALAEAGVRPPRRAPPPFVPNIGPPESPWQVSTPPSGKPAQTIVAASKSE